MGFGYRGKISSDTYNITEDFGDNVVVVSEVTDLPSASGGIIQLVDNHVYLFDDMILTNNSIELGNMTPIVGLHGGSSGFIYTGGGTALISNGNPVFMDKISIDAPAGTVFDLDGVDATTETLITDCSFANFSGMGEIASLGTIANFRVPSFKGCNFEGFQQGLTFTGSPDKVYIFGSPIRNITQAGVTCFTFDSNFTADIVDIPLNYVKDMQSDTQIFYVDPSATINDVFKYEGNTHDSTVNLDNILTGAASKDAVGYRVANSYPLSDSAIIGNYSLDATATTTINTQATDEDDADAYEVVQGSTSSIINIRFTHDNSTNSMTYIGKRDIVNQLQANLTLGTGDSDTVVVAWFKNGNIVEGSQIQVRLDGVFEIAGVDKSTACIGVCPFCETGDVYDVRVANLTSTTDIEITDMNASIVAVA